MILNTDLLEKFRKEINFSPMQLMNQKANDEDAFFIDYFKFYNSVSSIYSSKIEGEKMDADSYLKYKLMNVSFLPDLTKKIDDLFNAYTELPELELNYENFIKIHQLLSANLLPENERGKVRDNMMVVKKNVEEINVDDNELQTYHEKSSKELYNLCLEKGIQVESKKPKEYYINKLIG